MLQAMRDGANAGILKIVLMGLLVMAVGGLVLMDVGGFFRGGVPANVVAKGGGISLSAQEFDQTLRRVLARQGITPSEAYTRGMVHMVLTSEIQQRLIAQKAHDMGLRAGDDLVTAQIAKIAEGIAPAAGGSKSDALKQILRSQGISEAEFVQSVRQETANYLLQRSLGAGSSVIPAALTEDLYKAENQTRDVEAITFKNSTITNFEEPTEEGLQKYYESIKPQFAIPETRSVTLATLKRDMIESRVQISEEELKAEYENTIDSYTKPPMRRLQQAVVSDSAEADRIAAKVKKGEPLKAAAGTNYLGEEAFQESGLLEEISGPVFSAKPGDVIGPVQTALGWHVMVLTAVLPSDVTPYEKVKSEIKEELLQTRMLDDLIAAANEIDDRLAGGEELSVLVKEYGLTTQTLGAFRQNGADAKGNDLFKAYQSDKAALIQAAFEGQPGEVAPIIETADGQFVIVRIDAATPLEYKPFDSVKDTVKKQWIAEQQKVLNQARARDAHKRVLEGGETLEAVAKDLGVKVETFQNLKRDDKAPAALGALAMTRLFDIPKGDYILAEQEGGIALAGVKDISFPAVQKLSDEKREEIAAAVKRDSGNEMVGLFVSKLSDNTEIKVNEALLQQLYAQPLDGQ